HSPEHLFRLQGAPTFALRPGDTQPYFLAAGASPQNRARVRVCRVVRERPRRRSGAKFGDSYQVVQVDFGIGETHHVYPTPGYLERRPPTPGTIDFGLCVV